LVSESGGVKTNSKTKKKIKKKKVGETFSPLQRSEQPFSSPLVHKRRGATIKQNKMNDQNKNQETKK
jgi:hypothetical protein